MITCLSKESTLAYKFNKYFMLLVRKPKSKNNWLLLRNGEVRSNIIKICETPINSVSHRKKIKIKT